MAVNLVLTCLKESQAEAEKEKYREDDVNVAHEGNSQCECGREQHGHYGQLELVHFIVEYSTDERTQRVPAGPAGQNEGRRREVRIGLKHQIDQSRPDDAQAEADGDEARVQTTRFDKADFVLSNFTQHGRPFPCSFPLPFARRLVDLGHPFARRLRLFQLLLVKSAIVVVHGHFEHLFLEHLIQCNRRVHAQAVATVGGGSSLGVIEPTLSVGGGRCSFFILLEKTVSLGHTFCGRGLHLLLLLLLIFSFHL